MRHSLTSHDPASSEYLPALRAQACLRRLLPDFDGYHEPAVARHAQLLHDPEGQEIAMRYVPGGTLLPTDPQLPFRITLRPGDVVVNTAGYHIVHAEVTVDVTGISRVVCSVNVGGKPFSLALGVLARELPNVRSDVAPVHSRRLRLRRVVRFLTLGMFSQE